MFFFLSGACNICECGGRPLMTPPAPLLLPFPWTLLACMYSFLVEKSAGILKKRKKRDAK